MVGDVFANTSKTPLSFRAPPRSPPDGQPAAHPFPKVGEEYAGGGGEVGIAGEEGGGDGGGVVTRTGTANSILPLLAARLAVFLYQMQSGLDLIVDGKQLPPLPKSHSRTYVINCLLGLEQAYKTMKNMMSRKIPVIRVASHGNIKYGRGARSGSNLGGQRSTDTQNHIQWIGGPVNGQW